jgi:hypothetical protein
MPPQISALDSQLLRNFRENLRVLNKVQGSRRLKAAIEYTLIIISQSKRIINIYMKFFHRIGIKILLAVGIVKSREL